MAITHNCWEYVDNDGDFIRKGPVAIWDWFNAEACWLVVSVIGGPEKYKEIDLNLDLKTIAYTNNSYNNT